MVRKRVLVQWIGHSDLRAMAASLSSAERGELMQLLKGQLPDVGMVGPTATLIRSQSFDEIRLLTNYPEKWNTRYEEWLGVPVGMVPVTLEKPTDYAAILAVTDAELAALEQRYAGTAFELCLHLSPGTPAMAAVWLLLGKTRFPATFYETFGSQCTVVTVPFDLTLDVIPAMLRSADRHLQNLASEGPQDVEGFDQIVGNSQAIRDAVGRARRAAIRSVTVLLAGESGTGKELFAHAIHKASPRRSKPFVAVNCAAISKSLLESELFGHARGAFTGAEKDRKGAFELAHGGTLFLDEIGECDLDVQSKLLRVLQPLSGGSPGLRMIRRVGDERDREVDVRIIAATNRELQKEINRGAFREDLYYRLAAISIRLPPLRERKEDIPLIADAILQQINASFTAEEPKYVNKKLSGSAKKFVESYGWPGNVRQLGNALVQSAVLADSEQLTERDLAAAVGEVSGSNLLAPAAQSLGAGVDMEAILSAIQRNYLVLAMRDSGGVKAHAARLLGLKNYQTLDSQLKRLGVEAGRDY